MKIYCLIMILLHGCINFAMDCTNEEPHVIVVPGQNGYTPNKEILKKYLLSENITECGTPQYFPDFGQERCMADFDITIGSCILKCKPKSLIIHASSQGTATTINWLANNAGNEDIKKIKLVVLEAVMASGNSTICHAVDRLFPIAKKLPLRDYWLPYITKIIYPFYWPAGQQPILNIEKIPKDIPFIIIHGNNDSETPLSGARAIAGALHKNGNFVDLIIKASTASKLSEHVGLVIDDEIIISYIRDILVKFKLSSSPESEVKLSQSNNYYNFSDKAFSDMLNNLIAKEQRIRKFDVCLKGLMIATVIYALIRYGHLLPHNIFA